MMRLSPIRCSRKRTTHSWETSVKNDRMSASSMKFTFLLPIPPAADSDEQRVQRIMLAAPRPEPVREPEEILLVDRTQHCRRGPLDHLVFQSRDRQRALAPVFLRNVAPTRR